MDSRMEGTPIAASNEKRASLFERIKNLYGESTNYPTFADHQTVAIHEALVQEMANCFQEILGENPTTENLERSKKDFFEVTIGPYPADHQTERYEMNRREAERAYTRILEIIITRDKKEPLRPVDLDTVRTVEDVVVNVRQRFEVPRQRHPH